MLAGLLLIAMAVARMGRLIEFVPYPVTTGFTAGIAVVIGLLQVRDFLGLTVEEMPEHFLERLVALVRALPTAHWPDILIGALTLAILLLWPRLTRRVPPHLPALARRRRHRRRSAPGWSPASRWPPSTAASPASPPPLPPFAWPWTLPGPDGQPLGLSLALVRDLFPAAFAIAMLGAIESLLSAVVADGMSGSRHDPDAELLAQGMGNLVAPFFGGFAATGAIARTATNIRAGARSPLAAVIHAAVVLLAVLLLAPVLGRLPMAALAALLLVVACNMSEAKHFLHMLRVSPRADLAVLLVCFGLTVVFDMVIAVTVGVILAALLFMRRMAEVSGIRLVDRRERVRGLDHPAAPGRDPVRRGRAALLRRRPRRHDRARGSGQERAGGDPRPAGRALAGRHGARGPRVGLRAAARFRGVRHPGRRAAGAPAGHGAGGLARTSWARGHLPVLRARGGRGEKGLRMTPEERFLKMPKAEVHLHLEGTISPETLWDMAARNHVALPVGTLAELRQLYRFEHFGKFIELWLAMCACLKTPADYERMVDGFVAECARQNIRYVEAHFTPYNHELFGFGGRRALETVTPEAPGGGSRGRGRDPAHHGHPERGEGQERPLHRGVAGSRSEPDRGGDRPGRPRGRVPAQGDEALLRAGARRRVRGGGPRGGDRGGRSTSARRCSTCTCGECSTGCARWRTRRPCGCSPSARSAATWPSPATSA